MAGTLRRAASTPPGDAPVLPGMPPTADVPDTRDTPDAGVAPETAAVSRRRATPESANRVPRQRAAKAGGRRPTERAERTDRAEDVGPGGTGAPGLTARRRGRAQGRRGATGRRWDGPARDESGRGDPDGADSYSGDPDGVDPERDDPESIARLICLRLLTAAPRTQAELAATLRERGIPDNAARAVLARFAEVKLIDDATFARAWVESRHHSRGLAGRALGAELRRKGVAPEDIAGALQELDPEQEVTTARELVAKRLPATRGQPGPARMRRLTGMLARKGYGPGLAYRVVREALEQEAADTGRAAYYLAEIPEPDTEPDSDEDAEFTDL
jgi:regulatory protein